MNSKINEYSGNNKTDLSNKKCYFPITNSNIKIIHLVITRFLTNFYYPSEFINIINNDEYIKNGIRVIKKYLLPSLDNQSCKDFIWVIITESNIKKLISLLNLNTSFKWAIINKKHLKKYMRNITKDFDVLITTRIDYDDVIYWDAVNDVRKAININKPMILHGYNSGVFYFESNKKYYDLNINNRKGSSSIFLSLITVLNMVNDTYSIYEIGPHDLIRKYLLNNFTSYGIKKINYDPASFDGGTKKFIYVRQKFSHNKRMNYINANYKYINFNLSKFNGNK